MKLNHYAIFLAIIFLPACTWVELTENGNEVTLVKPFNVKNCVKLASTQTSTKHQVGIFTRSEETVTNELISIAKNRAAELGGDSIVSVKPLTEGSMGFDVYKCKE